MYNGWNWEVNETLMCILSRNLSCLKFGFWSKSFRSTLVEKKMNLLKILGLEFQNLILESCDVGCLMYYLCTNVGLNLWQIHLCWH